MVRFVHTADWQLGFHRGFLSDDAQARFTQARIDVIGTVARIAAAQKAQFVVVAGDVFESNQMDRRTVYRALEQMESIAVPVLLLPGNHDPLDATSIYTATSFEERCPANVIVLDDDEIRPLGDGVEVIGLPWTSNELLGDAVAARLAGLRPAEPGVTRIMVAHGVVDQLRMDRHNPAVIDTSVVEDGFGDQRLHYLALGDRHSKTSIGDSGRIWYAGAPEPTRFNEIAAGYVLCVDVTPSDCQVEPVKTGTWRFRTREIEVTADADVEALATWFDDVDDVARTIVRVRLSGVIGLRTMALLQDVLEAAGEVFACVDVVGLNTDLVAVADDGDLEAMQGGPVTRATIDELSAVVTAGGQDSSDAAEALALLYRLARRAA